jgi:hypothetical protein
LRGVGRLWDKDELLGSKRKIEWLLGSMGGGKLVRGLDVLRSRDYRFLQYDGTGTDQRLIIVEPLEYLCFMFLLFHNYAFPHLLLQFLQLLNLPKVIIRLIF